MVAPTDSRIRFLTALGRALHSYGIPAHRLEAALANAAARLDIRAEFLSTPTSLTSSFGEPGEQHVTLVRVQPGDLHLDKLVKLNAVVDGLTADELSVESAERRLTEIDTAPTRYGPVTTVAAFAVTAGLACRFFGGGWPEMASALVLGLVTGLLGWAAGRSETMARTFDFVAAAVVSFLAAAASVLVTPLATNEITIATLIVLLPGLTLTLALNELNMGHWVAGTARLTGSMTTFLKIGLGVGIGRKVAELVLGAAPATAPEPTPGWTLWFALAVTPLALGVLFRARAREIPWIVLGSAVAFLGAREGVGWLGPGLGTVVGSLAVGLLANIYARWRRKPAVVMVVPSIILLVPGSIGYQGLSMLMAKDVMSGVDTAFLALLVGVSLVAGLLLANVLVPPRNAL
ncbi:MAG: threonine/serine exporter family protein [bacterium]|nr:threonine/serine exporter family protein [bacterium]